MFGYACAETDVLPAPIYYSHKILKSMAEARRNGSVRGFEPDSKSQVTLRYVDGKPVGATSVVVSTQHAQNLSQDDVRELVRPFVEGALPDGWMCAEDEFYVNPTGRFVIGGPDGDAGVTGGKSSSTPTAARHRMAARFLRQGSDQAIASGHFPATWRRTWSPPVCQQVHHSATMLSAFPSRCRSTSIPMKPAKPTRPILSRRCRNWWI